MIELSKIDINLIDDANELIDIGQHAAKVVRKVDETRSTYELFSTFPYFCAELKSDGLIHLTLSKDPNEPDITFTPSDWDNVIIHLRDVYFVGLQSFAENIRNLAIAKADTLINP